MAAHHPYVTPEIFNNQLCGYVPGSFNCSTSVLQHLEKHGIELKRNPYPNGGEFASNWIPLKVLEAVEREKGNPSVPGYLYLKEEG